MLGRSSPQRAAYPLIVIEGVSNVSVLPYCERSTTRGDVVRKLLAMARTRVGYAAAGALLAVAGGGATAAAVMSPATDEVSDVSTVTTEPATTTAPETTQAPQVAPQAVPEVTPVEDPPVSQPAATVDDVTETEQPDPPAPAAEGSQAYDPTAPFTDEAGQTYTPAPPPPVDTPPAPEPNP